MFAFVVACATVAYAVITWRLVKETKDMRESQWMPEIAIFLQPKEHSLGIIDLVIQNVGLGPAFNIEFEVIQDFHILEKRPLSELGIFKKGMNYLATNQKYQTFVTSMYEKHEEKLEKSIEFKVTYEDYKRKKYDRHFLLELAEFEGLSQLGEPPLYTIAKSTKNMAERIRCLSSGFERLRVLTMTDREYEEKCRKQEEAFEQRIRDRQEENPS